MSETKIIDGGSAFPREDYQADCRLGQAGLTKRELFAAMSLQGLLGCNSLIGTYNEFSTRAIRSADSLLAKLEAVQTDDVAPSLAKKLLEVAERLESWSDSANSREILLATELRAEYAKVTGES